MRWRICPGRHSISDFERISDHAINIVESAQELQEKGLTLTPTGQDELQVYGRPVADILDLTVKGNDSWFRKEYTRLKEVYPLPQL